MIPTLIVPVLTRYEYLDTFCKSIDYPISQIIVIDNGNKCSLTLPHKAHVLSMPFNLGVSASWNLGIKVSPLSRYWLICNFDIRFPPGALQKIHEEAKDDALICSGNPGSLDCFTIGEKVIERVGLFDEAIYPAYFEDNDYCRRCRAAGIEILNLDILIPHDISSTLHSCEHFRERNNSTFESNRQYFDSKTNRGDLSAGQWSLSRVRANRWT